MIVTGTVPATFAGIFARIEDEPGTFTPPDGGTPVAPGALDRFFAAMEFIKKSPGFTELIEWARTTPDVAQDFFDKALQELKEKGLLA